jgi:hypothetical protein
MRCWAIDSQGRPPFSPYFRSTSFLIFFYDRVPLRGDQQRGIRIEIDRRRWLWLGIRSHRDQQGEILIEIARWSELQITREERGRGRTSSWWSCREPVLELRTPVVASDNGGRGSPLGTGHGLPPCGLLVRFHRGSIPGSGCARASQTTSADSDKENGKFLSGRKKKVSCLFCHQNFWSYLMVITSNFDYFLATTIHLISLRC